MQSPYKTPNRRSSPAPGTRSVKRRRLNVLDQVILSPVVGLVADGPRPDINSLDSDNEKVFSVLKKPDIDCDLLGVHRKDVITLDKFTDDYEPSLNASIAQNLKRYESAMKAEGVARGYNNACKNNVSCIRREWQEFEAEAEAKHRDFEAKHEAAMLEQTGWQAYETKSCIVAAAATQKRAEIETYKENLRAMATLDPESKQCAFMSNEELQAHTGVSSVAEIEKMPFRTVNGDMIELKNYGIEASEACSDFQFTVGQYQGMKIRYAISLGFPLAEVLDTFGLKDTLAAASGLFGQDKAKELLEEASHDMLVDTSRPPSSDTAEIQRMERQIQAIQAKMDALKGKAK